MKRTILISAISLLSLFLAFSQPQAPPFNVILIGWDGVQRDKFFEVYYGNLNGTGDSLPNIKRLSGDRIFNLIASDGDTHSNCGWSQILTGYNANLTGILNNDSKISIPLGYTIFEKLKTRFIDTNFINLVISANEGIIGTKCKNNTGVTDDEILCNANYSIDYCINGLKISDTVGNRTLKALEAYKNKSFFAFIQFDEPDFSGHSSGVNSNAYKSQIKHNDEWLGKIMEKLTKLGLMNKTFIYIVSDHGFDEGKSEHNNAPYTIFATNDPDVKRNGDRKDIAPTILKLYGILQNDNPSVPELDGMPLDSIPAVSCLSAGSFYIDFPGYPKPCAGLSTISLDKKITNCVVATGGTGDKSGYVTNCGNHQIDSLENECNCPVDFAATGNQESKSMDHKIMMNPVPCKDYLSFSSMLVGNMQTGISFFNCSGKKVKIDLLNYSLNKGILHCTFNTSDLVSGVYFYVFTTDRTTYMGHFVKD